MVRAQTINGHVVIPDGSIVLVSSKSRPGAFHELWWGMVCDGPSYNRHGDCEHVIAAEAAKAGETAECDSCGQPFPVDIGGCAPIIDLVNVRRGRQEGGY